MQDNDRLRLLAPNAFVLDWVHNNYRDLLNRYLDEVYGADAPEISLEIGSINKPNKVAAAPKAATQPTDVYSEPAPAQSQLPPV